jgi:glucokinase
MLSVGTGLGTGVILSRNKKYDVLPLEAGHSFISHKGNNEDDKRSDFISKKL